MVGALGALLALAGGAASGPAEEEPLLPKRVRRIVLHVLGSPTYDRPDRRHVFRTPSETFAAWKSTFGAQWIVWTDGTLWPRRVPSGEPASAAFPRDPAEAAAWRRRVLRDAAPVYSHLHLGNTASLGIEVAHSGRSSDPFPDVQLDTVALLLRTLLEASRGRLTEEAIVGHKDMDRRPAFISAGCIRRGCRVFVDDAGRPYRRRVDPPEGLFAGLARRGLAIPRPSGSDEDLHRAERLTPGAVPGSAAWKGGL
jgi:hypothetical protein